MTTCSANQSCPLGADRFCLAILARETVAWHKTTARRICPAQPTKFMPTAPPPSRDVALETRVFWERFKKEITAALLIVLLAVIAYTGYRFYSDRRTAAASALLASAKNAQQHQQVIDDLSRQIVTADLEFLAIGERSFDERFVLVHLGRLKNQ